MRERAEDQVLLGGGVLVIIRESFGTKWRPVVKAILGREVMDSVRFLWVIWWCFSGGMAGKWWREKAGLLGKFGGSIRRSSEVGKGAGLLEEGEEDFLWISGEKREGLGVGMLWDPPFSPGCSGLSPLLSSSSPFPLVFLFFFRFWSSLAGLAAGELMWRGRW